MVGETRGPVEREASSFTCSLCQQDLDLDSHSTACAFCEEVICVQEDLQALATQSCMGATMANNVVGNSSSSSSSSNVPLPPPPPTLEQKIQHGMKGLLRSIKYLDKHQIRHGMMARFKSVVMDLMKDHNLYNVLYLLSDFWKKFAGVAMQNPNCDLDAATSVEGHVVVGRIPPQNHPGLGPENRVNWDFFDESCVTHMGDGFFVLYVVQASQNVKQDWQQKMCNRVALLKELKEMLPHVNGVIGQSDGAYNDNFMALHLASLGKITGIHWLATAHNEAGHGGDRVDSRGAICIGQVWIFHRLLHVLYPIDNAPLLIKALDYNPMAGHFGRIVDHDETIWNPVNITYGTNKVLSFKDPKTKQTVPILDMLFKIYPVAGILPPGVFPDGAVEKFNGGIIFYRFLGQKLCGLGEGIGFEASHLLEMRGGNNLDSSVVVSSVRSRFRTTPETATYDLSREDKRLERERLRQVQSDRLEKKRVALASNLQRQRQHAAKSMKDNRKQTNAANKHTRTNANNNNNDNNNGNNAVGAGENGGPAAEQGGNGKITRSEALALVIDCVKGNYDTLKEASKQLMTEVEHINLSSLDMTVLEEGEIVVSSSDIITSIRESSGVWDKGLLGWKICNGPNINQKKVPVRRPKIENVLPRSHGARPHEKNKTKTPIQVEFLNRYANKLPKHVNAAKLSQLSITYCGALHQLETEQIKNHCMMWKTNQQKEMVHALARVGRTSYKGKNKNYVCY
jgi:hypothetical protein